MRVSLSILLPLIALSAWATAPPVARFTGNKGQWPASVAYRCMVPGGALFVERKALTYVLHSGGAQEHHGHAGHEVATPAHAHAFRVSFAGASQALPSGREQQAGHENFFLGRDPTAWGTGCAVYGEVGLAGLWPGIDLRMDGSQGLKYDFLVAAGADASVIRLVFQGQDDLRLRDGRLIVRTTAGTVIEEAPVAWQDGPQGRVGVRCSYVLEGNEVGFVFPEGYDHALPLVVDPVLTFGSYSGSTADNFGFTATYDATGHLYGGGIVFGVGYPSTLGALDPDFNGGTIDIGISKYTPDGSSLVWSTYIGGQGNESPHSLVVDDNDELYLLASTGSDDFPVTAGAFDESFNGGTGILSSGGWAGLAGGYGYGHAAGTDIAVVHFSSDATSLIAATYVGGSGNDGVNNVLPLSHNYGDHFRGEIALDGNQQPVVATSTQSTDMPISTDAPQAVFGGGVQDAYLFRMDPALASIEATYYGGAGDDSGYGVQFDTNGQVFATGGTTGTDLPMAGNPLQPAGSGGADAWVACWNSGLTQLVACTYLGTTAYDQGYFVQVDLADKIYVVGQSHGAFPVSAGVYNNPGSAQFIQKLSNDLSTSEWSTVIGNGQGDEDISPSAFLVSNCGQIYFSGWGGFVNGLAQASTSTTVGLPITTDAFQSNTDGSDFYLMVLNPDASSLNYATYFGGSSGEHVDGGTSRFDKDGTVYQAVCAGCGNQDDFPTTPGAWSNTNNSFNCNLGVFKFELATAVPEISIDGPGTFCLPGTVQFINNSSGGDSYAWDFGDGSTSSAFAPDHAYAGPGTWTVNMVLSDSYGCIAADSAQITITGVAPPEAEIAPVPPLCPGGSVQVQASGGDAYLWSPAIGVSDTTSPAPVITPVEGLSYMVVVSGLCGADSTTVSFTWVDPQGSAGADTSICLGNGVVLAASGGGSYAWSAAGSLSATDIADPTATPATSTTYTVTVTTPEGCEVVDSVFVAVFSGPPVPALTDTVICPGTAATLTAGQASWYQWQAAPGLAAGTDQSVQVTPTVPTTYVVLLINACGTVADSAFVDLDVVQAQAWPDTVVCPGEPVVLHASGGVAYLWEASGTTGDSLVLAPAQAGSWQVTATDALGCSATAQAVVGLHPQPVVHAGSDVMIDWGESTVLQALGNGTFQWSPATGLGCTDCAATVAQPDSSTTYTVQVMDANGCKATDQVTVFFRGSLFVPNTFTPNGDGVNELFQALVREADTFRLMVFDRWGAPIFSTDDPAQGWDGSHQGTPSPIGVYVWRVDLLELGGTSRTLFGHVTLLR